MEIWMTVESVGANCSSVCNCVCTWCLAAGRRLQHGKKILKISPQFVIMLVTRTSCKHITGVTILGKALSFGCSFGYLPVNSHFIRSFFHRNFLLLSSFHLFLVSLNETAVLISNIWRYCSMAVLINESDTLVMCNGQRDFISTDEWASYFSWVVHWGTCFVLSIKRKPLKL